jgi:predicted secreted hydrolase
MQMKKCAMICTILLLVIPLGTSSTITAQDPFYYDPYTTTLQDNTYNQTGQYTLQWWYLDASLNDSYSLHIGFLTIGAHATSGFFLIQINLYKDTILHIQRFELLPLRLMTVSTQEPLLRYHGQDLLKGFQNADDHLCLNISLTIKDLAIDLLFVGDTTGWVGPTTRGMWGCPLPKATVTGTITIQQHQVPVHGIGYQEHGWDVRGIHKSWYWGKCTTEHMNLIFSQSMKNPTNEEIFLAVLSTPNGNYTSLHRQNITLTHTTYTRNHGQQIPTESTLTIDEGPTKVQLHIHVLSIDYRTLLFIQYWRFHVHVTGTLTYQNTTEPVDEIQIMEIFHRL